MKLCSSVSTRQTTYRGFAVFLGFPNFTRLGSGAEQPSEEGACLSIPPVQFDGPQALRKSRSGTFDFTFYFPFKKAFGFA